MLVRSTIFSQMTGKFGEAVVMDGRAGMAARAFVIPTNPNTGAQQAVRTALRQVVASGLSRRYRPDPLMVRASKSRTASNFKKGRMRPARSSR